uniref:Uncharacterized protein n=1 Tax=Quercus lobata TaxID=97700 RepID=A0A7N2R161_QUELO
MLRAKMEYKWSEILTKALILLVLVNCDHTAAADRSVCFGCKPPCPKKLPIYVRGAKSCTNCNTAKSLPLLTTSPMALVLPTSTPPSLEPKKSQLFLPMLAPEPPKPTKDDSLAKQGFGFGATINVLYRYLVCGQGDNEFINNIISHYLYYLDLMGVGQEEARAHEELSCAEQVAFNPTSSSSP